MKTTSKELYSVILPLVESFKDDDIETLNLLVDKLMDHFGYNEFPIRGFNKMKQLGYLFQKLESTVDKETK